MTVYNHNRDEILQSSSTTKFPQTASSEMAVLFVCRKEKVMSSAKEIHCPLCNNVVAHYDGRSTINPIVNCRKCRKRIVYHIDTKKTEVKPIPPRKYSSGLEF